MTDADDYHADRFMAAEELHTRPRKKKRLRRVCTCADEDFCYVHPTDTPSLDPHGPRGEP